MCMYDVSVSLCVVWYVLCVFICDVYICVRYMNMCVHYTERMEGLAVDTNFVLLQFSYNCNYISKNKKGILRWVRRAPGDCAF